MNRREAIKHVGWGLSGGIWMPSLLGCGPSDPGPEISYAGTVAIIGAGAAGLYAADILQTKGIKVTIFEARDQIGGRVMSLRNQPVEKYPAAPSMSSDFPIELGAETILGSDSIMGKIIRAYNLTTTEYTESSHRYVLDNQPKSSQDWTTAGDADFLAAKNFRANLKSQAGSALTVQQAAAGVGTRAQGMLNGQIGNAYGSNNNKVGVGEIGEEETLRATDGKILCLKSNPYQDTLISRFNAVQSKVILNTPIISVSHGSDPITLIAKDGTVYEADKVIITVPVSILKTGAMAFTPALPAAFQSSLSKIAMGPSLRVILEFKKNFWTNEAGFILGSENVPQYLSLGMGRSAFNSTLSVTVNGDKASQYSSLGEGVVNTILADIDAMYAGQGTQFIRQDATTNKNIFVIQDWTKETYIQGGYSYPQAGAKNSDRAAIGQPVNDKLFFAGEATDITGQAGMVNGALASAERVTEEIIKVIKAEA